MAEREGMRRRQGWRRWAANLGWLALGLAATSAGAVSNNAPATLAEDLGALYAGLSPSCGVPAFNKDIAGGVKILGEPAFPIISSGDGKNNHLGGAARYGKGRLAVLGHHDYREVLLKSKRMGSGCDTRYMENLFSWLTLGRGNGFAAQRSSGGKMNLLVKNIQDPAKKAWALDPSWPIQIVAADKLDRSVLDPNKNPVVFINEQLEPAEADAVEAYLKDGGAVLWINRFWTLVSYPWKPVADSVAPAKVEFSNYPAMRLLMKAGMEPIYWGNGSAQAYLDADQVRLSYPLTALDYWVKVNVFSQPISKVPGLTGADDAQRQTKLDNMAAEAFRLDPQPPQVATLVKDMKNTLSAALHGPKKSLDCKADARTCKVAQWYYGAMGLAANQPADSTADVFPGLVPAGSPRIKGISVTLDTSRPGHGFNAAGHTWESTGLYAAPGENIWVNLEGNAPDGAVELRIGAHSDLLVSRDSIPRAPRITATLLLKKGVNVVSNPFGGLVFLETRAEGNYSSTVTFSNVIRAPHFRLGRDKDADWNGSIKNNPAPWGEVEGKRWIMVAPVADLRKLTQPEKIARKWDNMVAEFDKFMDLSANDPGLHKTNAWPWREVADIEISGGYMHSGYPIMTHLDAPKAWFDEASNLPFLGIWGDWHELGHNVQLGLATWSGNNEVSNNLHSLNIQALNGSTELLVADKVYDKAWAYLAQPQRDFQSQKDLWIRLTFLQQFQHAYRQKNFWQKVHRTYREMQAKQVSDKRLQGLPFGNDVEKINSFAIVASVIAGENVLPHFDAWGFPQITQATRNTIAGFNLPNPRQALWKMRSDCRALKAKTPNADCEIPPGM